MLNGKAFIGASLGSKLFTREWVRSAYDFILSRHEELLVVIADELWLYTRLFSSHGDSNPVQVVRRMRQMQSEMRGLFESIRSQLPLPLQQKVRVISWEEYSDAEYAHLLRMVRSGSVYVEEFSAAIDRAARDHSVKLAVSGQVFPNSVMASRDYILDEVAMCLRITEVAGFSFEYYPGEDLSVLRDLYNGVFGARNLTVESLVGHGATRVFTFINSSAQVPSGGVLPRSKNGADPLHIRPLAC